MREPQVFYLNRIEDKSGVSGTGVVAWGTLFPNGKVALAFISKVSNIIFYDSLADALEIHGHDGATIMQLYDFTERDRNKLAKLMEE